MKDEKQDERRCANEGCERNAEEGSVLCAECNLEWSLFHREFRAEDLIDASVRVPGSGIPVSPA
jgi:hypothetical protein